MTDEACPDCCGVCVNSTYPYGIIDVYDFPSEKEYRTLCRKRKETGCTKLRCGSEPCPKFERRSCGNCGEGSIFNIWGGRAPDWCVFCNKNMQDYADEEEHGCWRH